MKVWLIHLQSPGHGVAGMLSRVSVRQDVAEVHTGHPTSRGNKEKIGGNVLLSQGQLITRIHTIGLTKTELEQKEKSQRALIRQWIVQGGRRHRAGPCVGLFLLMFRTTTRAGTEATAMSGTDKRRIKVRLVSRNKQIPLRMNQRPHYPQRLSPNPCLP